MARLPSVPQKSCCSSIAAAIAGRLCLIYWYSLTKTKTELNISTELGTQTEPSLVCCQRLTFLYFVFLSIVTDCGWSRSLQVTQRAVVIQCDIVAIDAGLNERFFDPLIFDPVCPGHTIVHVHSVKHLVFLKVVHGYCINHRFYFSKQNLTYNCRTIFSVIQIYYYSEFYTRPADLRYKLVNIYC